MQLSNLEGQVLDQYQLLELLGKGAMGVVYRAEQITLKRSVAIKILAGANATKEKNVRRFVREAKTAAALEHPNIVPIYDFGTERRMNYVVMRLLSGGSLSDKVTEMTDEERYPLTLLEVSEMLKQIGSALDYAHSAGVIHRDIKPSNVMFDNHNNAFLVDFGLVKLLDSTESQLTGAGMILGTPAFMAPEQWREEELTPAVDQYSLGIIVYLLVTGRLPFQEASPYELMNSHCNVNPPPPHHERNDISSAVTNVIMRAMAKNPFDRFPNTTEFALAFQQAINLPPDYIPPVGADTVDSQMITAPPAPVVPKGLSTGVLIVEESRDGAMVGKTIRFDKFPFQMGRLTRDLNFNDDRNVSRNHAHITRNEMGDFYIEDQGSTLHTFVNDVEIPPYNPVKLTHNSVVCLGTTTILTFLIEN